MIELRNVYALAKSAERNNSKFHTDVADLAELGLIDRNDDVPILASMIQSQLSYLGLCDLTE